MFLYYKKWINECFKYRHTHTTHYKEKASRLEPTFSFWNFYTLSYRIGKLKLKRIYISPQSFVGDKLYWEKFLVRALQLKQQSLPLCSVDGVMNSQCGSIWGKGWDRKREEEKQAGRRAKLELFPVESKRTEE